MKVSEEDMGRKEGRKEDEEGELPLISPLLTSPKCSSDIKPRGTVNTFPVNKSSFQPKIYTKFSFIKDVRSALCLNSLNTSNLPTPLQPSKANPLKQKLQAGSERDPADPGEGGNCVEEAALVSKEERNKGLERTAPWSKTAQDQGCRQDQADSNLKTNPKGCGYEDIKENKRKGQDAITSSNSAPTKNWKRSSTSPYNPTDGDLLESLKGGQEPPGNPEWQEGLEVAAIWGSRYHTPQGKGDAQNSEHTQHGDLSNQTEQKLCKYTPTMQEDMLAPQEFKRTRIVATAADTEEGRQPNTITTLEATGQEQLTPQINDQQLEKQHEQAELGGAPIQIETDPPRLATLTNTPPISFQVTDSETSYLTPEEWEQLVASYPAAPLGELSRGTNGAMNVNSGKDSGKETLKVREDIWVSLLHTMQLSVNAIQYQSDKMDLQLSVLNSLSIFVANIDGKLAELNNLVRRAQAETQLIQPNCSCITIVDKLATLPTAMDNLLSDIRDAVKNNPLDGSARKRGETSPPLLAGTQPLTQESPQPTTEPYSNWETADAKKAVPNNSEQNGGTQTPLNTNTMPLDKNLQKEIAPEHLQPGKQGRKRKRKGRNQKKKTTVIAWGKSNTSVNTTPDLTEDRLVQMRDGLEMEYNLRETRTQEGRKKPKRKTPQKIKPATSPSQKKEDRCPRGRPQGATTAESPTGTEST